MAKGRGSRLRSRRQAELAPRLDWAPNVWMGVSVETAAHLSRIDDLRAAAAAVRFLSLEPLLGPLPEIDLTGVDWVIAGGESGPHARAIDASWVVGIRDQCRRARVPFFFKQWGGTNKKKAGRLLDGRAWSEMPKARAATGACPKSQVAGAIVAGEWR